LFIIIEITTNIVIRIIIEITTQTIYVKTIIMDITIKIIIISRTPMIEATDVGLGYFPIHPLHAQHLLGLVREPQMVGTRRSKAKTRSQGQNLL